MTASAVTIQAPTFKVNGQALAEAVKCAKRGISRRNAIPVLTCVHLIATGESVVVRATDLEVELAVSVPARVEQEGETVVPADVLSDLLKQIPFGDVAVQADHLHFTTKLRWGSSSYMLHGFNADQFPHVPKAHNDTGLELTQPALKKILSQAVFACSRDETRPFLTGVHFVINGSELMAEATDGIRIARTGRTIDNPGGFEMNAIIPARSLKELSRVLSDKDADMARIFLAKNHVCFDLGTVRVVSRLLDGQYPEVMWQVPASYPTSVRLAKSHFLQVCKRAGAICFDALKLSVQPEIVTITANAPVVGQAHEEILAPSSGPAVDIGFHPDLFTDGLKAMSEPEFILELSGSRSPARLRPVDGGDFTYVVLPLITY